MKNLSERDICSKFITPAVTNAGWDLLTQIREEVSFTKGRIIVRGRLHSRGEQKRIVTKIEKLIALCDELKFRIQQASAKQKQIADVLVSQAIH